MADITDAIAANYKEISTIAKSAFTDLKLASAGGFVNASPAPLNKNTLQFDPGLPVPIILNSPVDLAKIMTTIDSYIAKMGSIQTPVFPPAPNMTMQDHELWISTLATQMKSSLQQYITTMGIPDVTFQNAIFNEEYERNKQTLNDLYDLADAKTGARGFSYTNDFGNSLKLDAQQKYQFDKTQISRTISKTITEWARLNYQFAIEKGLAYETMEMDFTYKFSTAFVQIYKEMILAILETYKAQIEVLVAPIDALVKELNADIAFSQLSVEVGKTNEGLKQSRATIEISEALQKYGHDVQLANNELGIRMNALEQIVAQSAGLAQANTQSIIQLVSG
jgi:hypothetical protein